MFLNTLIWLRLCAKPVQKNINYQLYATAFAEQCFKMFFCYPGYDDKVHPAAKRLNVMIWGAWKNLLSVNVPMSIPIRGSSTRLGHSNEQLVKAETENVYFEK